MAMNDLPEKGVMMGIMFFSACGVRWNRKYAVGVDEDFFDVLNKKILFDRRYDEPLSIYSRLVEMTI